MKYTIHRAPQALGNPTANWEAQLWQAADTLDIAMYRWEDSGHHPPTQARILYDDGHLALIFRVEDRYVRAVAENFGDPVSNDSCVEFFVSPYAMEQTDAYFNFEFNCGGTMLLRRCSSSAEREWGRSNGLLAESDALTVTVAGTLPRVVEPEITEPTTWCLEYHIPLALFHRYFIDCPPPFAGTEWKANFYKCGNLTSHPHFGAWAPIETDSPSYHNPEYFQPLHFA
jgi:hypothetical protein